MKRRLKTGSECRRHCHPQGFKPAYPLLSDVELIDYKVRILPPDDQASGTGATTRVLIEFADSDGRSWRTVGVSTNIIDASVIALADGMCWKLLHAGVTA